MSYWKSPSCCELCQGKLVGTAEIITLNKDNQSVLIVKQSLITNWAFCPLCRGAVCKAECFDRGSGYCKACESETEIKPVDFNERVAVPNTNDDILSAETIF
jgi:hypothetical protein